MAGKSAPCPLRARLRETEGLIRKARKAGQQTAGLDAKARCLKALIRAIADGNYHIWHLYLT